MEKNNALVQLLVTGISGGLIVLFFYLIKRFSKSGPKIVIGKKAGLVILGICVLLILTILILPSIR